MSFQERIDDARREINREVALKKKESALQEEEIKKLMDEGMDAARNRLADRYLELEATGLIDLIEEITYHRIILSRPVPPEEQKKTSQGFDPNFRIIDKKEDTKRIIDEASKAMHWSVITSTPSLNERGVWDTSLKIFITKRDTYHGDPPKTTFIFYHDPSKRLRISGRQTTFWGPVPEGDEGKKVLENSLAKAFADPFRHEYRSKEVPPHSHFGPDQKIRY